MTIGNPKHDRWCAARKGGASKEEAARAALPGEPEGSPRLKYWAENGDKIAGYVDTGSVEKAPVAPKRRRGRPPKKRPPED